MSGHSFNVALSKIGTNGHVSAEEVLFLRRNVFADGVVTPAELDALFELGDRAPTGDREWTDFFAEAAADFYLREEEPHGYLTEEEFRTLKSRVTRNGERASTLELALLVKLLETARSTPEEMSGFVGAQIKRMVAERKSGARLTADDAALVRRWLFAAGGDGNVAVTRKEAELLFDLNDLSANDENDPTWTDLFCEAVANHLMAHLGYAPPSRAEALKTQAFMADHSVNVGRTLGGVFSGGLRGLAKRFTKDIDDEATLQARKNADRAMNAAIAEKITDTEADWLAARIAKDGAVHKNERALVKHLKSLEAELPPKLKAIVEKATPLDRRGL